MVSVVALLLVAGFLDVDVVPVVVPVSSFVVLLLVVVVFDSDVLLADELCVSVELSSEELSLSLLLSLLSFLDESDSFLLLSSPSFFLESSEKLLELVLLTEETRGAPSLVLVTELVTTLVAPSANAIERIANGVMMGGVRYAMVHSSLFLHLPYYLTGHLKKWSKFA